MQSQNEAMRRVYQEELVPSSLVARINNQSLLSFITMSEASGMIAKPDQLKQKIADFQKLQAELSDSEEAVHGAAAFGCGRGAAEEVQRR